MFRIALFVLSLGLFALWLVGLFSPLAAPWMVWLDGAVAVGAFGLAAASDSTSRFEDHYTAGPLGLAMGLGLFGAIGALEGVVNWLVGATLAFALGFGAVALIAWNDARTSRSQPDRVRRLADTLNDRIRKAG